LLGLAGRRGRFRLLGLWQQWESFAMRAWHVVSIKPGAILQFGRSPFRGRSTVLADGTRVMTGDPILHLHLDNAALERERCSEEGGLWHLARVLASDLDDLARLVRAGELGEVRALRGVTVLAVVAGRLGFEVRPLAHGLTTAAVRQIAALVLVAYDPHRLERLDRGLPGPGEIWMSRDALLSRLQPQPSQPASPRADRTGPPALDQ
jgi:YkoP-like protein